MNAVAPQSKQGFRMTARQVESLMGIEAGGLGPIAWLVIQEEANNVPRERLAKALGVTVEDISEMILQVTGAETQEIAESTWMRGIVSIKTADLLTQTAISRGWDTVEAAAIQKLNNALEKMTGDGDAEQMLRIAATANKAMRRKAGETPAAERGPNTTQIDVGVSLQSGGLGSIRLNLSPRIQEQMSKRTIDVTPGKSTLGNLNMLNMTETRDLIPATSEAEEASTLDSKTKFEFDLSEGPMTLLEVIDSLEKGP